MLLIRNTSVYYWLDGISSLKNSDWASVSAATPIIQHYNRDMTGAESENGKCDAAKSESISQSETFETEHRVSFDKQRKSSEHFIVFLPKINTRTVIWKLRPTSAAVASWKKESNSLTWRHVEGPTQECQGQMDGRTN